MLSLNIKEPESINAEVTKLDVRSEVKRNIKTASETNYN